MSSRKLEFFGVLNAKIRVGGDTISQPFEFKMQIMEFLCA